MEQLQGLNGILSTQHMARAKPNKRDSIDYNYSPSHLLKSRAYKED